MNKEERKNRFFMILMVGFMVACFSILSVLIESAIVFVLIRLGMLKGLTYQAVTSVPVLIIAFITNYLVALLMIVLLSKIPLRPVNLLIEKMNKLTSGDYSVRIKMGENLGRYSELKRLSESFNTLAEELGNTEMLREDFINNFSHEFKTPIVSIAGFAKLLKKKHLTDAQREEYLNIIEEESLRLSSMATNVLNLTKIENQTILADVIEFNLSEQIRKCILMAERKWQKKNLKFEMELDEHIVAGNEELLKQVWINLIDNAVKFSAENSVIFLEVREDSCIEVAIKNTGKVVPKEQQKKIFNKFYQGDESHSEEGNGIGLALVKHVVELHRGTVSVHSENETTIFTVKIPKKANSFVSV